MLLNEKERRHLEKAIARAASLYMYSPDMYNIILEDAARNVIMNAEKYMDRILENTPKIYRGKIRRAIETLRENLPKTVKMIEQPPTWFKNAVLVYFLWSIGYPYNPRNIILKHMDEMVRVFPLILDTGVYVKYKGKDFKGLILYPTDKELENMHIKKPLGMEMYERLLNLIINKKIEFIPEKQAVRIYDYEIVFPRSTYYKIARKKYMTTIIEKLLREDLEPILPELEKYTDKIEVSETHIEMSIKKDIIKEIEKELGLGIKKITVHVDTTPETRSGTGYIKAMIIGRGELTLKKPYTNICATKNCSTDKDKFTFNDYTELPGLVKYMLDRLKEIALFIEERLNYIRERAEKKGFKISISYPDGYHDPDRPYIYISKEVNPLVHIKAKADIDLESGTSFVSYTVYLDVKKKIPEYVIEEAAEKIGLREGFKLNWYKGWSIHSSEYTLGELETVLEQAERLANAVYNAYNTYISTVRQRRAKVKVSPEQYVALYINNFMSKTFYEVPRIDVEKATGRPELLMYSTVARIAMNLGCESYSPKRYPDVIIYELFTKNYITVDEGFRAYINGKRYKELLKDFGIDPTVLEAAEQHFAEWLVANYVLVRTNEIGVKANPLKILHEKNMFTDTIVQRLIEHDLIYIRPEDMAADINGKPAWQYLSPVTKKLYIEKLYLEDLEKIYFSPRLRNVFSDVLDDIRQELLSSGNASIVTKIVVRENPGIIGYRKTARIVEEQGPDNDLYGIDVGAYIVQVLETGPLVNKFIVYSKKTKTGFLFIGKTITDVVAEALSKYDKMHYKYRKIVAERRGRINLALLVLSHERYGSSYKIPYIISRGRKMYLDEYTLEKLGDMLKNNKIHGRHPETVVV